jgi:hypothetical protein
VKLKKKFHRADATRETFRGANQGLALSANGLLASMTHVRAHRSPNAAWSTATAWSSDFSIFHLIFPSLPLLLLHHSLPPPSILLLFSAFTMTETFISQADGNEVFQAQYIPKQKGPPASDHPSMKAYISTYPALGQVTQIDKGTAVFTALLEVDESRALDSWQISLWHSEGKKWQEVPMDPLRNVEAHPTVLQSTNASSGPALTRLYFTTPLAIHLPTNFTIKFRGGVDKPWKWVKDHQGTTDGIVMLKSVTSEDAISSDLGQYIEGLNPTLKSKNYRSQSPGTTLWSVEASVEAVDGEKSIIKDIKFGLPWGAGKFSR